MRVVLQRVRRARVTVDGEEVGAMGVGLVRAYKKGDPLFSPRDRTMKIHEYQAKELLASAGANVPPGIVASSAAATSGADWV